MVPTDVTGPWSREFEAVLVLEPRLRPIADEAASGFYSVSCAWTANMIDDWRPQVLAVLGPRRVDGDRRRDGEAVSIGDAVRSYLEQLEDTWERYASLSAFDTVLAERSIAEWFWSCLEALCAAPCGHDHQPRDWMDADAMDFDELTIRSYS